LLGDSGNPRNVGSHVLPDAPVTTSRRLGKHTTLIPERQRKAINLEFTDVLSCDREP
jgi:hypothetical protein